MKDKDKTKEQLIGELVELRRQNAELKKPEIRHRKEDEEFLKIEEKKELILASISEIVVYLDKEYKVIWANRMSGESVGLKSDELIGRHCYEIWRQRSRPCSSCPVVKVFKTGKFHRGEIVAQDGCIWAMRAYPVKDEKNSIIGAIEIEMDITERKQAEKLLLESEMKYRSLVEKAKDGIYIIAPDGFKYVNPAFEELTGYSLNEICREGFNFWDIIHPDDIKFFKEREITRKRRAEVPSRYEFRIITKNGETKTVEPTTMDMSQKEKVRIMGILRDVTDRKQAEVTLQRYQEELNTIFNSDPVGILYKDTQNRILRINKVGAEVVGLKAEDIAGKSVKELFPEADADHYFEDDLEVMKSGKPKLNIEERMQTASGERRWVRTDKVPYRNENGDITGVIAFFSDITERKKAEEEREQLQAQLIQSEKMAGIGTLSSGIAHEFNNLLQIMSGHVQFAEKTKKAEDIKEAFDIVLSTTDRASKIIQDLLTFSRTEETKRELCSIKEPLESVLSLTEDQLKKNNIVVVKKYGRTSNLKVNKGEIKQVFLNMVTNARDAMLPRGGRLKIGIRQEKGQVKVSFHDTGKGIRKEDLGRVFEPFYTTKGAVGGSEAIAGTGLGLSVSYGIVKRHGGVIEVESKVGKGTTFTIKLPIKGAKKKIVKQKKKKESSNDNR